MADLVTSLRMSFLTLNDLNWNKDDDTVITVALNDANQQAISRFKGYGGGPDGLAKCEYAPNSVNSVPLPLNGLSLDNFGNSVNIFLRIDTNGNDTWFFGATLMVQFQVNPPLSFSNGVNIKLTERSAEWRGQFHRV